MRLAFNRASQMRLPARTVSWASAQAIVAACLGLLIACGGVLGERPHAGRTKTLPRPAEAIPSGIQKIRHVVIIMQENRSFDSYFGTFPGADGIPGIAGHPGTVPCVPDTGTSAGHPIAPTGGVSRAH